MGCRAAETTCNINNAFGPGTANERTVQWWFKKFCKGDERLEEEEHSARPSETDDNQEHHRSWSSYDRRSCQMTQYWPFYCHLEFEANWKGETVQEVDTCELPPNQKNHSLKLHLLLFCTTMKHFLMGLWSLMKSGLYTTGNYQLSGWTRMTLQSISQSQTCTKKRSRSLFGGPLPVSSTAEFWTPVNPLYLRHMLRKLTR